MSVRVAVTQFGVGTDVEENLATVLRMIDRAVADCAPDVVVLPEFLNHCSWYDDEAHAREVACALDGPFLAAIGERAARHGCWVMANVTVRRGDDAGLTGSNVLFDRRGRQVLVTDKQVLMGAENDHLVPSTVISPLLDTDIGTLGLYSCMDGVINETPRSLGVRGAQLLLNSLNSFAADEASLHIPVRAPENRVFVAAANKVGPLLPPDVTAFVSQNMGVPAAMLQGAGEAQIVAPDGTVLAIAPTHGEAVVWADVDVSLADDKTRPDGTDVMRSRRPDAYGPLGDAPKGRQAPAGADELRVAVVQPAVPATADEVDDVVTAAVAEAVAAGASLVVLPELRGDADALASALEGTSAAVVLSRLTADAHEGLVVTSEGIVHRQPTLHACGRHGTATALARAVEVVEFPWGRLAVLAGGDTVYPEAFRLAALQDADVVACPTAVLEPWEVVTGFRERAAENKLVVVAATAPSVAGTSIVCDLPADAQLWGEGRTSAFDGNINNPVVHRAVNAPTTLHATVHPVRAADRVITKQTDVVDSRPWRLLAPLLTEV